MDVSVVETRYDGTSAEIDAARRRVAITKFVPAHRHDASALHHDGFADGERGVDSNNFSVVEDQIRRFALSEQVRRGPGQRGASHRAQKLTSQEAHAAPFLRQAARYGITIIPAPVTSLLRSQARSNLSDAAS